MDILVILLLLATLWGAKISLKGHPDYIGRSQTDSLKGFFAIIILFSHMLGYLPEEPSGNDTLFRTIPVMFGQLMVVMFLFYSGYGIMESLKRDRRKYTANFLTHRLLKTWIMFAIAVSLYFLLSVSIGSEYETDDYLLCWIGWTSIGNSNWFVFDILVLYLLTYLGLLIANALKKDLRAISNLIFLMSLLLIAGFIAIDKDWYWYDTILAYPAGMVYSTHKQRIENSLRGYRWIAAFIVATALFAITIIGFNTVYDRPDALSKLLRTGFMLATPLLFSFAVVLLTMKLRFSNPLLRWLGVNAFAIYILQRLSMNLCAHYGLNGNEVLFASIVIPSTLLIAAIFTAATNRMNNALFKK